MAQSSLRTTLFKSTLTSSWTNLIPGQLYGPSYCIWFLCSTVDSQYKTCVLGDLTVDLWTSLSCPSATCLASYPSFSQSSLADNAWRTSQNTAFLSSPLPSPPSTTRCPTGSSSLTRLQSSTSSLLPLVCSLWSCLVSFMNVWVLHNSAFTGENSLSVYLNKNDTRKDFQHC